MKIALIFPGIGYHVDKPLLYYSKKLAVSLGYEVVEVTYGNFPEKVKGAEEKMREAFETALVQTRERLASIYWQQYDEILMISKSIGTAVASAYASEQNLKTRNLFYTPVEQSFPLMTQPGIVFHGTSDTWADTERMKLLCEEKGYPIYLYEDANHSLETGNPLADIFNLQKIMELSADYMKETVCNSNQEDGYIYEQLSLFPAVSRTRELTEKEKQEYDALAEGAEQMVLKF